MAEKKYVDNIKFDSLKDEPFLFPSDRHLRKRRVSDIMARNKANVGSSVNSGKRGGADRTGGLNTGLSPMEKYAYPRGQTGLSGNTVGRSNPGNSASMLGKTNNGFMSWKDKQGNDQRVNLFTSKDGKSSALNNDGSEYQFQNTLSKISSGPETSAPMAPVSPAVNTNSNIFGSSQQSSIYRSKLDSIEGKLSNIPSELDPFSPKGISWIINSKNLRNQRDNIYSAINTQVNSSSKTRSGSSFQEKSLLQNQKDIASDNRQAKQNNFDVHAKIFDLDQERHTTESDQAFKTRTALAGKKADFMKQLVSDGTLTPGSNNYNKTVAAINMQFDSIYNSLMGSDSGSKKTGEIDITDPGNPKNQTK